MSLTKTELIYLMAYVDGEVDDDELPEVTALLARSDEARQIVAQHSAFGDWVRATNEVRAIEAGADFIARDVLLEVEKLGGGKVIEIERQRAKEALNRQRVREFGALGAIAAIAAGFWFAPHQADPIALETLTQDHAAARTVPVAPDHPPADHPPADPASSNASPGNPASDIAQADPAATPGDAPPSDPANPGIDPAVAVGDPELPGVDVQSVESPSHPFSIFYVPAATGLNAHSSSVVVWIGE